MAQITGKFRKGDIVKSIDDAPVAFYWRGCTFEVIELDSKYRGYRLKPLDPPPKFYEEDLVWVYANESLLYIAIDQNDIRWWMNNNA